MLSTTDHITWHAISRLHSCWRQQQQQKQHFIFQHLQQTKISIVLSICPSVLLSAWSSSSVHPSPPRKTDGLRVCQSAGLSVCLSVFLSFFWPLRQAKCFSFHYRKFPFYHLPQLRVLPCSHPKLLLRDLLTFDKFCGKNSCRWKRKPNQTISNWTEYKPKSCVFWRNKSATQQNDRPIQQRHRQMDGRTDIS